MDSPKNTVSIGPLIGLLIIIGIILFGGIYYFYKNVEEDAERNGAVEQNIIDEPSIESELKSLDSETIEQIGSDLF